MARQKYMPKEYWTDEQLKKEAAPFTKRNDFKNGNHRAWNIARKRGSEFMDTICAHMDPPLTAAYTDEELKAAALKHGSRGEFCDKDPNAYHAAHKRGKAFLDLICQDMSPLLHSAYTDEELHSIALPYGSIMDFKNGNSGAYSAAYDRGPEFLKKICSHMKRTISKPERTILEAVLTICPTAKKFRATKLNIPGKEYIKTLEVDIFVKELGKGIEYDSRRFHSIEGLTRGHPTWPKEHIPQYHEIKDVAFASLGIQILHITQDEWEISPEACIERCLNFLKISEQKAA